MENGLFDITMVSFVFTPMVLTVTLPLCIWWVRTRNSRSTMDRPRLLLAAAVRQMPEEHRDWGAAMIAELSQLRGSYSRWWFALGCARVALFPPRRGGLPQSFMRTLTRQDPICGVLSVTLPPLGLPFLFFAAVICEALVKQGGVSTSELGPGVTRALVLLTISWILAGLPFGVAGWVRRERLRWLSVMGSLLSFCIFLYVIVLLHLLDGGD